MLLLYVVPELFKRRSKKYEYPEVPQPVPVPVEEQVQHSVPEPTWSPSLPKSQGKPMSEAAAPIEVISVQETGDSWQGNISHASVINGFIYAEVLQPPRAMRPFEFKTVRTSARICNHQN